jgi:hypothetical protein
MGRARHEVLRRPQGDGDGGRHARMPDRVPGHRPRAHGVPDQGDPVLRQAERDAQVPHGRVEVTRQHSIVVERP